MSLNSVNKQWELGENRSGGVVNLDPAWIASFYDRKVVTGIAPEKDLLGNFRPAIVPENSEGFEIWTDCQNLSQRRTRRGWFNGNGAYSQGDNQNQSFHKSGQTLSPE